jgi:palmitoyltransferase
VPETEDPSWQTAHLPRPEVGPVWRGSEGIQSIPSRPDQLPDLYSEQHPGSLFLFQPPAVPAGHELPMSFSGGSVRASHGGDFMSFGGRPSAATMYPSSSPTPPPPSQPVHPMPPAPAHTGLQPSLAPPIATTSRIPRPTPPVVVGPRWCAHCKIIKPDRTHHCRHCGTCVLQFDRASTCAGAVADRQITAFG